MTINTLVVKSRLPAFGVVSTHPERVERLIQRLEHPKLHTQHWGTTIHTGMYAGREIFISCVPMGSAGAGFAFFEMYHWGAKYIIRFGSNDYKVAEFTPEHLNTIVLVKSADNLHGLMRDAGEAEAEIGSAISASNKLVSALYYQAKSLKLKVEEGVCHNIDNYHAMNFPEHAVFNPLKSNIQQHINNLTTHSNELHQSWDMESTALFYLAKKLNCHAASVLQFIPKHTKEHCYAGDNRNQLLAIEDKISQLIFNTLTSIEGEGCAK